MAKYLDNIINEVFNIANTIEDIEDQGIFDIIHETHSRLSYKSTVIVYANVCEMLFGDSDAKEIISDMM